MWSGISDWKSTAMRASWRPDGKPPTADRQLLKHGNLVGSRRPTVSAPVVIRSNSWQVPEDRERVGSAGRSSRPASRHDPPGSCR